VPTVTPTATPTPDTTYRYTDDLGYAEERTRVLELVNEERAKLGLSPLKTASIQSVNEGTMLRATEIIESFSHTRPNGERFIDTPGIAGTFTRAGENIAWGQTSPEQVMDSWMNSQGHKDNILDENFTELAVGVSRGSDGRWYWVQILVKPR
jgi:uncharacterized protein YkwD